MANYIDTFVVPVPTAKLAAYRELAELSAKVWLDHGALSYAEFLADDVKPGKLTSFPQSVDLKPDETVLIAIMAYTSRQHRDEVNAKAMQDPRMTGMDHGALPFDPKRMFWGGFSAFVLA